MLQVFFLYKYFCLRKQKIGKNKTKVTDFSTWELAHVSSSYANLCFQFNFTPRKAFYLLGGLKRQQNRFKIKHHWLYKETDAALARAKFFLFVCFALFCFVSNCHRSWGSPLGQIPERGHRAVRDTCARLHAMLPVPPLWRAGLTASHGHLPPVAVIPPPPAPQEGRLHVPEPPPPDAAVPQPQIGASSHITQLHAVCMWSLRSVSIGPQSPSVPSPSALICPIEQPSIHLLSFPTLPVRPSPHNVL